MASATSHIFNIWIYRVGPRALAQLGGVKILRQAIAWV
jgi:hypothetical protein